VRLLMDFMPVTGEAREVPLVISSMSFSIQKIIHNLV
jgi:hypothetical protein